MIKQPLVSSCESLLHFLYSAALPYGCVTLLDDAASLLHENLQCSFFSEWAISGNSSSVTADTCCISPLQFLHNGHQICHQCSSACSAAEISPTSCLNGSPAPLYCSYLCSLPVAQASVISISAPATVNGSSAQVLVIGIEQLCHSPIIDLSLPSPH